MKLCKKCGQLVAEEIMVCPACGNDVAEGRKTIDDYRILDVLHEGYSSILCKAIRNGEDTPVMIRIFTLQSGVDEAIAQRLQQELERLKELPEDYFVRHLEIKKSRDGLWYRVSEWIEAENWGTLLASGKLNDLNTIVGLFYAVEYRKPRVYPWMNERLQPFTQRLVFECEWLVGQRPKP